LNSGPHTALYHLRNASALLALGIFQIGYCIYALDNLNHDIPNYASLVAGMTSTWHHAQFLLVEMGS
jgi:hypothetical protein